MSDYERYWSTDSPPPSTDPLHPYKARLLTRALSTALSGQASVRVLELGGGALHHWAFVAPDLRARALLVNNEVSDAASAHVPAGLLGSFGQYSRVQELTGGLDPFDVLASFEVLEHINPVRPVVARLRHACGDSATWVGTVPYHGWLKNMALSLAWERHFPIDNEHVQFFSRRTLCRLVEEAGWDVEAVGRIGRVPYLSKSLSWLAKAAPPP